MNSNIIVIGPLPPPNYGQSLGFESLYIELNKIAKVLLIDIQPIFSKPGTGWKITRVAEYFFKFIKYFYYLLITKNSCKIYITIGQSNSSFCRDFIFIFLGCLFKRKIYCHLKGGNFRFFYKNSTFYFKFLIKIIYRRVHKIIVLGKSIENSFDFCNKINSKVVIVENGLTIDLLKKIKLTKKNKTLNILYLSNLIISKGYLDLVSSLEILDKKDINYKCFFAGEIYKSPDDPKEIRDKNLKKFFFNKIQKFKNVEYLGSVKSSQKEKLLTKCDVFVLPTYYVNEGQPISIIEAMAYGNVIISTKYRSIPDLITNEKEGFLINPKNPDAIAKILIDLSQNNEKLTDMKINAINTYLKNFTREKHLSKMLKTLEL